MERESRQESCEKEQRHSNNLLPGANRASVDRITTRSSGRPPGPASGNVTRPRVVAGCITDAVLGRRGAAAALAVAGAAVLVTATVASPASRSHVSLHRPLHLPRLAPGAPCPVSHVDSSVSFASRFGTGAGLGAGPAFPILPTGVLQLAPAANFNSKSWAGQKVLWLVLPSYRGPVLIRGGRLDGNSLVRFQTGNLPPAQLTIPVYTRGVQPGGLTPPTGTRYLPSYTRLRGPGCYAYQIDGTTFSRVIVFSAVSVQP